MKSQFGGGPKASQFGGRPGGLAANANLRTPQFGSSAGPSMGGSAPPSGATGAGAAMGPPGVAASTPIPQPQMGALYNNPGAAAPGSSQGPPAGEVLGGAGGPDPGLAQEYFGGGADEEDAREQTRKMRRIDGDALNYLPPEEIADAHQKKFINDWEQNFYEGFLDIYVRSFSVDDVRPILSVGVSSSLCRGNEYKLQFLAVRWAREILGHTPPVQKRCLFLV